jgi:geranylgeranyl diphosphate synthase type II
LEGASDSDDLADFRPSLILSIAHKRAEGGRDLELMEGLWRREIDSNETREEILTFLKRHGIVTKARELCDAYERQAVDALRPMSHASVKGLLRRVIGKIFGDQNLIEGYCGEFEARNAAGRALSAEPIS